MNSQNILYIKILIIIIVISKGILTFNPELITGFSIILLSFTISRLISTIAYTYLDVEINNIYSKVNMLLITRNNFLVHSINTCTQIIITEKLIINIFTILVTTLIKLLNTRLRDNYDIKFNVILLKMYSIEGVYLQPILKRLISSINHTQELNK